MYNNRTVFPKPNHTSLANCSFKSEIVDEARGGKAIVKENKEQIKTDLTELVDILHNKGDISDIVKQVNKIFKLTNGSALPKDLNTKLLLQPYELYKILKTIPLFKNQDKQDDHLGKIFLELYFKSKNANFDLSEVAPPTDPKQKRNNIIEAKYVESYQGIYSNFIKSLIHKIKKHSLRYVETPDGKKQYPSPEDAQKRYKVAIGIVYSVLCCEEISSDIQKDPILTQSLKKLLTTKELQGSTLNEIKEEILNGKMAEAQKEYALAQRKKDVEEAKCSIKINLERIKENLNRIILGDLHFNKGEEVELNSLGIVMSEPDKEHNNTRHLYSDDPNKKLQTTILSNLENVVVTISSKSGKPEPITYTINPDGTIYKNNSPINDILEQNKIFDELNKYLHNTVSNIPPYHTAYHNFGPSTELLSLKELMNRNIKTK